MQTVISYLIPSYNHASYLPDLLESIRLDILELKVVAEVIIIDDGSQDQSLSLIETWADKNDDYFTIKVIAQENKGITKVLNDLISLAEGEYIRLGASDDKIIPGSTQFLYDTFMKDKALLCAFGDGYVIDANNKVIHRSSVAYHHGNTKRLLDPKTFVKELVQNWCLAGPTLLIKKEHYKTMHYDENSNIDDYDLFLSLLAKPGAVAYVDRIVCCYRIHLTNTSKTKNTEKRIANIRNFLDIIHRYIDKEPLKTCLMPMKYKTKAKLYFLQKKYIQCGYNMFLSLFYGLRT